MSATLGGDGDGGGGGVDPLCSREERAKEDIKRSSEVRRRMAEEEEGERGMSLGEVLEKIRPRVILGPKLPPDLVAPWRYEPPSTGPPATSLTPEETDLVNRLLESSLRAQSATVPGSGDFDDFVMSNSSMVVAGLVRSYLRRALRSETEVASVVLGVLLWREEARNDEEDFEGTPHLWLEVAGCPVDNVNVAFPGGEEKRHLLYECKTRELYCKEDPFSSKRKLCFGSWDEDDPTELATGTKHNLKVYREYGNDANVEKFCVLALSHPDLNPSARMYDLLMREALEKEFGVEEQEGEDLLKKWDTRCWKCGRHYSENVKNENKKEKKRKRINVSCTENPDSLRTCTGCHLARYCGRTCQQADWQGHRLLHKEVKITRQVLVENAERDRLDGQLEGMMM